MTEYLLDTNVPSELVRSRPDPLVLAWFLAQSEATLHLSAITIGELRKGLHLLPVGARRTSYETWFREELLPSFASRIWPVTAAIADRWGALTAQRKLAGRPLSAPDGLIAATALEHGFTLVTRNVKDYTDLGVSILNPWDEPKQ